MHRDVSPKNVMVTFDGHVKVIDFGIAKAKGRLGRTQVGMVKGTTGYMSPEQVRGSEQLDGRSDLFCAGIILHELLCGRRLFSGAHEGEVMLKIAEAAAPSPSSLNPRVPQALSQVVMRALARAPEERFASGREMARAIEAACGPELFHEEQLAAVMRQLFEDKLQKTRALLESANAPERNTNAGMPALPLGGGRSSPPAPVGSPRAAKPPSGQGAPVEPPPAKTPAARRASPPAAPSRPPARGGYSRPMPVEPEDTDEEDPLEKTQPVRRAPGFRSASVADETAGTEEHEATVASAPPRAQLSPAALAELEKPRRSWGGWLFLLLLLGAVGGAIYHPATRAMLTPLYATALEHLKGEEPLRGPPPAEPLPLPQNPTSAELAAGEGTQAPEPTPQPVAEQETVARAEPRPAPSRLRAHEGRVQADAEAGRHPGQGRRRAGAPSPSPLPRRHRPPSRRPTASPRSSTRAPPGGRRRRSSAGSRCAPSLAPRCSTVTISSAPRRCARSRCPWTPTGCW